MIARHFAQHLKRQDWMAIVIELVIVILGVFMGLQVDNWNQARQDRAREAYVIAQLTGDMNAIHDEAERNTTRYRNTAAAVDRIMALLKSDQETPRDSASFVTDLNRVVSRGFPVWRSPTFVELLSSGQLQLIADNMLRRELVRFDQEMQNAIYQDKALFNFWRHYDYTLNRPVTLADSIDAKGAHLSIASYDLKAMRHDPAYLTALQQTKRIALISIQADQNLENRAVQVIDLLKKAKP